RAPRWSEATLVMSLRAGATTSWDASEATAAPQNASSAASQAIPFFSVRMVGHPLRHRLGLVGLGVPRHQDEESEVHDCEHTRGVGIRRSGRLQAQVAEREGADREREQGTAKQPDAGA